MKLIRCTLGEVIVSGAQRSLTLTAAEMPRVRPGQLLLLRVGETLDSYLPAAYFPLPPGAGGGPGSATAALSAATAGVGAAHTSLALLVAADDPLVRAAGQTLDAIAPVGNGFTLDAATRRLLLVGDAAWLAPLLALAHAACEQQLAVSLLVYTAPEPDTAELAQWLAQVLPLDVEYQLSAQPASVLPALLGWADQVCAAGDGGLYAMLRDLAGRVGRMLPGGIKLSRREAREAAGLPPGFVQVLVAPPMACGTGACQGCAVETARGLRLACIEGPAFDLAELA